MGFSVSLWLLLSAAPSTCAQTFAEMEAELALYSTAEVRMHLTANILTERCDREIPKSVSQSLKGMMRQVAIAPSTATAQALAVIVRAEPALWNRACPTGIRAFAEAAVAANAREGLFDACHWEKGFELGSRDEVSKAVAPGLGAIAYLILRETLGLPIGRARRYARALGGF
jgi:hypothetical protein